MKQQINELKRMQKLAGVVNEGFQGDDNDGDGLSGFRGNSSRVPATHSMSPIQQREALVKAWGKVPLGSRMHSGGSDTIIPKELLNILDDMGYAICHK